MMFAEAKTPRQAFDALDIDQIDDLAKTVEDFHARGLLKCDSPLEGESGLQDVLNKEIFSDPKLVTKISGWLREGRVAVITDALSVDLAERAYNELDQTTEWKITEGAHDFFHHRHCTIGSLERCGPALTECSRLLRSTSTRHFISKITGQDCTGEAAVVAAWYRPGEYALPHDDSSAATSRSVAFIWYLTKDWRREWGGSLFWCPTGQYVSPGFNVLVIFNVMPENVHLVCPVAPGATMKRLAIGGFWHKAGRASEQSAVTAHAVVSPRAYGRPSIDCTDLSPLIVL
jgi:hypothetical protein